jgi:poly(3-hydroxyalkanoate) depolymerase
MEVLGQEIRVSVRPGAAGTLPLVLCNGIGASLELLQPFVDRVDRDIPVIRFDVPGVGDSPLPRVPYRFSTLGWLLGRLIERLGHRRFDLLGISWGGGLAQQMALQNPRRCRRLILVATGTGSLMVPAHPSVLAKMVTPRRYRDPDYARRIAADLYGGQLRSQPDLAKRVLYHHARPGSRRGYRLQLFAGLGWTSLPALSLVRQRTLILAGRDDPIIPLANARIMHRLLPNATTHIYDDGHLGLITNAADLGPLVSTFLRAH